ECLLKQVVKTGTEGKAVQEFIDSRKAYILDRREHFPDGRDPEIKKQFIRSRKRMKDTLTEALMQVPSLESLFRKRNSESGEMTQYEGENKLDSAARNLLAVQPINDTPGLPRVLLIGDSISIGYTLHVRELLAGKANVHRVPVNCGATEVG